MMASSSRLKILVLLLLPQLAVSQTPAATTSTTTTQPSAASPSPASTQSPGSILTSVAPASVTTTNLPTATTPTQITSTTTTPTTRTPTTTAATTTLSPLVPVQDVIATAGNDANTELDISWTIQQVHKDLPAEIDLRDVTPVHGVSQRVNVPVDQSASVRRTATVSGLQPGHIYNITVKHERGQESILSDAIVGITAPKVEGVTVQKANESSITLHVTLPSYGYSNTYNIAYRSVEPVVEAEHTVSGSFDLSGLVTVVWLKSGNRYRFSVNTGTTVAGVTTQSIEILDVHSFTVPERSTNIRHSDINNIFENELSIVWENRGYSRYYETCLASTTTAVTTCKLLNVTFVAQPLLQQTFSQLVAGDIYDVTVSAWVDEDFRVPSETVQLATKPSAPIQLQLEATTSELSVRWNSTGRAEQYVVERRCDLTQPTLEKTLVIMPGELMHEFKRLMPGDSCTVSVRAQTLTSISDVLSGEKYTKPLPPRESTTAAVVSDKEATIYWLPPDQSGFADYSIDLIDSSGSTIERRTSITQERITFTLNSAESFVASVYSVTRDQQRSEQPLNISFATLPTAVPSADFYTSNSSTSLIMHWNLPDDATRITKFSVWLTNGSNAQIFQAADVDSSHTYHVFTQLTPGAGYIGHVAGVYDEKEGAVTLTQQQATKPSKPIKGSVQVTETTITVHWQKGIGNCHGFYIGVTSPPLIPLSSTATSHVFQGLNPGETKSIYLHSTAFQQISEEVLYRATLIPGTPTALEASVRQQEADLLWNPPNGVVSGYHVQVDKHPDFRSGETHDISTSQITISSLDPGTKYFWRVRSRSSTQVSEFVTSEFTTIPLGALDPSVTVLNETAARITWSAPTGVISAYVIQLSPGNTWHASETSFTFTGLFPGRRYTASVTSRSGDQSADPVHVDFATCPLSVTQLSSTSHYTDSIQLSWFYPHSSSDVHDFTIQLEDSTRRIEASSSVQSFSVTYTDLPAGEQFIFTVKSHNYKGDFCSPKQLTAYTKPKRPVEITVTVRSPRTADVSLTQADHSRQTSSELLVRRLNPTVAWDSSLPLQPITPGSSIPSVHSLINLTPGAPYEAHGSFTSYGVKSEDVSTIFLQIPLAPTTLSYMIGSLRSDGVRLAWTIDSLSRRTGFIIQYSDLHNPGRSSQIQLDSTAQEHSLTSLGSGRTYGMVVLAYSQYNSLQQMSVESEKIFVTTIPELGGSCRLTESNNVDSTTAVAEISSCLNQNSKIDRFFVEIGRASSNSMLSSKNISISSTSINFDSNDGVQPGYSYRISLRAKSGGHQGSNVALSERRESRVTTDPAKPVAEPVPTESEIRLTLRKSRGYVSHYEVSCVTRDQALCSSTRQGPFVDGQLLVFSNLRPFEEHFFNIKYYSEGRYKSSTTTLSVVTRKSVPGPVRSLRVTQPRVVDAPRDVEVSWQEPARKNGVMKKYLITWYSTLPRPTSVQRREVTDIKPNYAFLLELQPGWTYRVQVIPFNEVGSGQGSEVISYIEVSSPLLSEQAANLSPSLVSSTDTTLTVTLNRNTFSDRHGMPQKYQVIVFPEPVSRLRRQTATYGTWSDSRDSGFSAPYMADIPCNLFDRAAMCPDTVGEAVANNSFETVLYTLGTEDCESSQGMCNGPLPVRNFRLSLRAYTSDSMYRDSPRSQIMSTSTVEESSFPVAIVAGSVAAGVLLLIIIIAIIVVRRRKRSNKDKPQSSHLVESKEVTTISPRSQPIRMSEFENYYHEMSADSNSLFNDQFDRLRSVGVHQTCIAGEKPANNEKNRFINILPYDHSRVKLSLQPGDPNSDYINANFIPGFNSVNEFISTQGPLPNTIADFWRMVWEQKCRSIIMLTRCVERQMDKCERYWPSGHHPEKHGDIEVKVINETQAHDWNISKIKLTKKSRDVSPRVITHFHYTAWPDFTVPGNPGSILRFVRLVRSQLPHDYNNPVIVHCSAGVGRTGTFVVLDWCLQAIGLRRQVNMSAKIDPFGIVHKLREARVNMVQTEQQYVLIHRCLLAVARGEEGYDEGLEEVKHERRGEARADDRRQHGVYQQRGFKGSTAWATFNN